MHSVRFGYKKCGHKNNWWLCLLFHLIANAMQWIKYGRLCYIPLGSCSSWLLFCCCMWWWQLHLWCCQLYWACCNKVSTSYCSANFLPNSHIKWCIAYPLLHEIGVWTVSKSDLFFVISMQNEILYFFPLEWIKEAVHCINAYFTL